MSDGKGLRYDDGKVRYDLIPPEWEHALAEVLTAGANKYAARNWERGMPWSKMVGCARRHLFKFLRGEVYDPETHCHHLAHVAWNVLALMSYHLRGVGENDIPQPVIEPTRADHPDRPNPRTYRDPGVASWPVELPEGHEEVVSSPERRPQSRRVSPGEALDRLLGEQASLREQQKEAQDLLRREAHLASLQSGPQAWRVDGSDDAHDDGA